VYFPYLRGKQTEILAVRESSGFLAAGRIVPVFEPTNVKPLAEARFLRIAQDGVRFAVIVNSAHGTVGIPSESDVAQLINRIEAQNPGMVLPAFEIRSDADLAGLTQFAQQFASRRCVIVHRDHNLSGGALQGATRPLGQAPVQILREGGPAESAIRSLRSAGIVLLRDGFRRRDRNADYPSLSSFDDLFYTYRRRRFHGFSDFSIVGDHFGRGGNPQTVALHLTEPSQNNIVTNHFVSRYPPASVAISVHYLDALALLKAYTGVPANAPFDTQGVGLFLESFRRGSYHALWKPKQWSMMHHMEFIDREFQRMGTSTFI